MSIIKALLLVCGAAPALANRATVWLDGVTEENITSGLEVTSTCCNSGGSVVFHTTNDLHCLSYWCMTMHGGANQPLGFLNPGNWAEEKSQCHKMGFLTWNELRAGRPDIGQFAYQDLFNDPAYFGYLIEKFMGMGVLPLCGSLNGVNWNSSPATGSTDDLYSNLIAKIKTSTTPETPSNAQPTDMDGQDKGWKLAALGQDTKKAVYNFEDSMEGFVSATRAPGRGQASLEQGQRNQHKAFIAVFLGAFESGRKASVEAIGGAAEAAYGAPGAILGKAQKMWQAYEERKKQREEEDLRQWAKKEWDRMQDQWDRQMQEESRQRREAQAQQLELEDKEAAREREAKTFAYELKLLEDLVDRGLPDPPVPPVHDADTPVMERVYAKLNGHHGRLEHFVQRADDRSRATRLSGPQLSFHAATLRCAREWLECDLRQQDCGDTAQLWVNLTHGGGAAPRCRQLHGELRTLVASTSTRGTRHFPEIGASYESVPLSELSVSVRGLPRRGPAQYTPDAQKFIMAAYQFLLEQWAAPQSQICGSRTPCLAGEAALDFILPKEPKIDLGGQAAGWAQHRPPARRHA